MRLKTYTLKGLRELALDSVDWHPSASTTFQDKVDALINARVQQLGDDLPESLVEVQERDIAFQVDYDTGTADVNSSDSHVVEVDTTEATWATDGSWSGRWIRLAIGSQHHYRRIQEVWTDLGTAKHRLSVDKPFPSGTGLSYLIYSEGLWLPADMSEVIALRINESGANNYALTPRTRSDLEALGRFGVEPLNVPSSSTYPSVFYLGEWDKILDPQVAPELETSNNNWAGPEPAGSFRFIYTYVWGADIVEGPQDINPPRLESAASEISDTEVIASAAGKAVYIKTPNIEWHRGYGDSGTVRYQHGGIRKRIYVARTALDAGAAAIQQLEVSNIFYYLTEIDGDQESFEWDGSTSPIHQIRYTPSHGRRIIRLDPRPNRDMRFFLRARMRPPHLADDGDAVRLPVEVAPLLMTALKAELYRMKKEYAEADKQEAMYRAEIAQQNAVKKEASRYTRYRRGSPYQPRLRHERVPPRFTGGS